MGVPSSCRKGRWGGKVKRCTTAKHKPRCQVIPYGGARPGPGKVARSQKVWRKADDKGARGVYEKGGNYGNSCFGAGIAGST